MEAGLLPGAAWGLGMSWTLIDGEEGIGSKGIAGFFCAGPSYLEMMSNLFKYLIQSSFTNILLKVSCRYMSYY